MNRIDFYLTTPQLAALRQLSKDTGLSVAELLRRALDAFLKQQKKERKP